MQFPRINAAINFTLLYYEKHQIVMGVGQYSKAIQRMGVLFNGALLPTWDTMVLNSHQAMEEEIQQIINLNYPHVRDIVFENLREVLTDVRIKTLNKEWIIKIADENNEAENKRLLEHPKGFAVLVNKDYLQHYFALVENAISNLKRIINKYLKLYDEGKLPQQQYNKLLPQNTSPIVRDDSRILKVNMTVEKLAFLFRTLKDAGLIKGSDKEIAKFIVDHFETTARKGKKISAANLVKLFSTKDTDVITFWKARFKEIKEKTDAK